MPSTHLRKTVLATAKRIVVKMGTQLISNAEGAIDLPYIRRIADQIAALRKGGREVTVVSSGAIGSGCAELGLAKRPRDMTALQAVAAVGQRRLMTRMHDAFARHDLPVGQVLLTRDDFDDRVRFLNIRNCVTRLHKLGCVPIINENDTVMVEELEALRVGDNDLLAAMICNALRADALILLTVVDGLEDASGQCVDLVDEVQRSLEYVRGERSPLGKGGMYSKLVAAKLVTDAGEIVVIANGRERNVLPRLFNGEKIGTVILPANRKLDSRQRWIALTARPTGQVAIDDGAARAITARGKSLLATGIVGATGCFERGEVLLVHDQKGREIARGLSNYSVGEIRLIMGKRSNQFEKILGRPAYDEVIHRDNMVVKT